MVCFFTGVLLDELFVNIHAEGAAAGHQHAVNGAHGRRNNGHNHNGAQHVREEGKHQVREHEVGVVEELVAEIGAAHVADNHAADEDGAQPDGQHDGRNVNRLFVLDGEVRLHKLRQAPRGEGIHGREQEQVAPAHRARRLKQGRVRCSNACGDFGGAADNEEARHQHGQHAEGHHDALNNVCVAARHIASENKVYARNARHQEHGHLIAQAQQAGQRKRTALDDAHHVGNHEK